MIGEVSWESKRNRTWPGGPLSMDGASSTVANKGKSLVPFKGSKKSLDPSKSLDFVPGPFRILELAPFNDLAG
jgi:hypothetical protein